MSLLDSQNLIEIDLYYKQIDIGTGKRLVIVDDVKGKEAVASDDKTVETLKTKWSLLTWKEQNEVMNLSSQTVNQQTGERQFNFLAYRDAMVKRCLREWNITINEKPVPVSPDAIDKLPGPVVTSLYQKFERLIDYSEKELGN